MKLKDIIAISGEAGLFRFLAQGRNSIIVENLETGKRHSAPASAKVSSLEEIAIFTEGEELKLSVVFDRIWEKESGGTAPDHKAAPAVLNSFFEGVVPEYDKSRVYASDIKKVLQWYNILHKLNMLIKDDSGETGEEETAREEVKADAAADLKKPPRVREKKNTVKKGAGSQAPKRMPPSQRKSG